MIGPLALAAAVLSGCSAGPRPDLSAESGFGATKEAAGALEAKISFPEEASCFAYSIVEGDNEGETLLIERVKTGEKGEWEHRRRREGRKEPERIDRIRVESDGSVVLIETETAEHAVISRYDPPLVLAPAKLAPGETAEQSITLTVHPMSDPEKVNHRGRATNRITYVGDQTVQTGEGAIVAARLEAEFEADLGVTKVKNTTIEWRAEPYGLIAERGDEQARALGLLVSSLRRTILLSGPCE